MTEKVDVQDTETGRKYTIPARWLELDHPQFKRFKKTATSRRRTRPRARPPGRPLPLRPRRTDHGEDDR